MTCLETTILIDLTRGDEKARSTLEDLQNNGYLTVAAPSITELWVGAIFSTKSETEKAKINELISSLIVLPLDEKSAKEAGEIEAELSKQGVIIDPEDIMIAGICRANGEKLVTRDAHYARITGLKLLKY